MDLMRNMTMDTIMNMDNDTEMCTESKVCNFFSFIKDGQFTFKGVHMLTRWLVQFKVPGKVKYKLDEPVCV